MYQISVFVYYLCPPKSRWKAIIFRRVLTNPIFRCHIQICLLLYSGKTLLSHIISHSHCVRIPMMPMCPWYSQPKKSVGFSVPLLLSHKRAWRATAPAPARGGRSFGGDWEVLCNFGFHQQKCGSLCQNCEIPIWLVVSTPLKFICVSWDHYSQLNGKIKKCSKPPSSNDSGSHWLP